jgi:hypothetical protein
VTWGFFKDKGKIMTEKDYLHEQLRLLQMSYERAARPIIDKLIHIENLNPRPIVVSMSDIKLWSTELAIQAKEALAKAQE